MLEILKAIFYGIVEGITEWLPVSSTGHLILLKQWMPLKVSEEFWEMFQVVVQLGAIAAVLVLFFHKLNPFALSKTPEQKKTTWALWFRVVVAVLPSAVLGLLLDDWMDEHLYNHVTVAITLILYGVVFLYLERFRKGKATLRKPETVPYKTAIYIGLFQCLAMIPGTSRSGATILGAMLLGMSRSAAAEFSFFLAIPTMLGASLLKAVKFAVSGVNITGLEVGILVTGCLVAFVVSLLVIRGLMNYVKKHSFATFGLYRIVLGLVVLLTFLFSL